MENEKPPNLGGRPTDYTPQLRDIICGLLAQGKTLRAVCRMDGMPERQTIYNWLTKNIGEVRNEAGEVLEVGFFDHYTRAREIGLDEINDEMVEIADDGQNDWMEVVINKRGDTKTVLNKEAVLRSRLRVDTRLSYLANMAPRKYGKNVKIENQTLDKDGKPTDPATGGAVIVAQDSLTEALAAVITGKAKGEQVDRQLEQERATALPT